MKKNLFNILFFISVIFNIALLTFILFHYCWNNKAIDKTSLNNEVSNQIWGNIENNFHISSVANSEKIQITYEPIDKEELAWPVEIDYKVYENQNLIEKWNYNYNKNQTPVKINILRKEDKKYTIVSDITDKNQQKVNKSSLTINRLDEIKTEQTLSFQDEINHIKNNINDIVSNFEKEPINWNWYTVDIRFIKTQDEIAKKENWTTNINSDAVVIFEDGHYSYLVKLEKENNKYKPVWYYNFVQKPGEKVWWKYIETKEELNIWEVIHHWSIDQ